jgi:hypothetical protein
VIAGARVVLQCDRDHLARFVVTVTCEKESIFV